MERLSLRIGDNNRKTINQVYKALSTFRYEDGYSFSAVDLGTHGVKIELSRAYDIGAAIILPPERVHDCGKWLLQTIGQDSFGLPKELTDILSRLVKHEKAGKILQRGDKAKIKEALKALRCEQRKAKTEGKTLKLISANAI